MTRYPVALCAFLLSLSAVSAEERSLTVDMTMAEEPGELLDGKSAPSIDSDATTGYQRPSDVLAAVLGAQPLPDVTISPDRKWLLLAWRADMPSIDEVAARRVGVLNIDPRTNGMAGNPFDRGTGMTLVRVADGQQWALSVPSSGLGAAVWSADSQRFMFRHTADDRVELWVGDVSRRQASALKDVRLVAAQKNSTSCVWMPESPQALCQTIPEGRGARPERSELDPGPLILESTQTQSRLPFFVGRLQDAHDDALYEYYKTAQLVLIDTVTGERKPVGSPGIYDLISPSPDGRYLLSLRTVRPYSHTFPESEFPKEFEVLDIHEGSVRTLMKRPEGRLGVSMPNGGVHPGRRRFSWIPDSPATLVYVEALDGGDPRVDVPYRDRLMRLDAPFGGPPIELFATRGRMLRAAQEATRFYAGEFFPNRVWLRGGKAWVEEYDLASQRKRAWQIDLHDPKRRPQLMVGPDMIDGRGADISVNLVLSSGAGNLDGFEEPIALQDGDWVYLTGIEPSSEGARSILDRLNLKTNKRERLFRTSGESYESVVAVLDERSILTRFETPSDPPNFYIRDLKRGERRAVTKIPHPAPELRAVKPQFLQYVRDDGAPLSGELYLPPDYKPGQRVPVLIWAYPMNYASATAAGKSLGSPYTYLWSSSEVPLLLAARLVTTQGYAFLNASMPIIGEPHANDTAVPQMIANARAAIDKLVGMGIAERSKVAVAGHSYGAYMTSILLAHSNLFAAGIAIDGGFNASHNPMGFQQEKRTLWQAPQVYQQLSSLWYADKITAPLLLIHGEKDNNPGALPMEAERMYQALDALGRKVRLVMLPHEGHAPDARESIGHISWEIVNWLDRYVKKKGEGESGGCAVEGRCGGAVLEVRCQEVRCQVHIQVFDVCHERERSSRCCAGDGSWPPEIGLQEQVSNRQVLLRLNGCGGERPWKRATNGVKVTYRHSDHRVKQKVPVGKESAPSCV